MPKGKKGVGKKLPLPSKKGEHEARTDTPKSKHYLVILAHFILWFVNKYYLCAIRIKSK